MKEATQRALQAVHRAPHVKALSLSFYHHAPLSAAVTMPLHLERLTVHARSNAFGASTDLRALQAHRCPGMRVTCCINEGMHGAKQRLSVRPYLVLQQTGAFWELRVQFDGEFEADSWAQAALSRVLCSRFFATQITCPVLSVPPAEAVRLDFKWVPHVAADPYGFEWLPGPGHRMLAWEAVSARPGCFEVNVEEGVQALRVAGCSGGVPSHEPAWVLVLQVPRECVITGLPCDKLESGVLEGKLVWRNKAAEGRKLVRDEDLLVFA